MSEINKICPDCRAEYLPKASICADCNVPLNWDNAEIPPIISDDLESPQWNDFPPNTILGHLTGDKEEIIKIYQGHFKVAGIRSAVLPRTIYQTGELQFSNSPVFGRTVSGGKGGQIPIGDVVKGFEFDIFVPRENYERAGEIVEELFTDLHPGQENGFSQEFDISNCPACGFDVNEAASECPDCGLCFG